MSDVESRVKDDYSNLENVVKSLEAQLAEKSEEIMNIRESKEFSLTDKVKAIGKKLLNKTSLMQNLLV